MKAFLDSNVLHYAFTTDSKTAAAREMVRRGGVVSVQCRNEFAAVARRKFRLD